MKARKLLSFVSCVSCVSCVLSITILSLAAARAESPSGVSIADHAALETTIVGITATALIPAVTRVSPEVAFGWLNYTDQEASIRFDDTDIVSKMLCRSPDPFRVTSDQLHAPRVPSGGFATLCSFVPGEYAYVVTLSGSARELTGRLVVE